MKWRNEIKVKHMFSEEPTIQDTQDIASYMVRQLKLIQEKEKNDIDQKDINRLSVASYEEIEYDLDEIIEDFEMIVLIEYDDAEECVNDFNYNFYRLFDIGDCVVMTANKDIEKFLWVG